MAAARHGARRAALRPAIAVAALLAVAAAPAAARVRVAGSSTVNPVVVDAAAILRAERGIAVSVDTLGGSSGGIAALGDGRAEVAMSSRPLSAGDRDKYPTVSFRITEIGRDALALVVSRDVWEAGVRALDREQARSIYERRVRNWRELGGHDQRIVFFNKEPGRGTWEVFARWLYGHAERAPLVSLPEVGSNEEARGKVRSTRGAITQLSAAWADGHDTYALALRRADGTVVRPPAAPGGEGYPLTRPLYLVTRGRPAGEIAELVGLLLSPRGQALVARHGYLPVAAEESP